MGWVVNSTPRSVYPGKDLVPILQEAEWSPGLFWTGAENFAPTGIYFRTVQPVASHYNDCAISAQYVVHEFKTNKIISRDLYWASES